MFRKIIKHILKVEQLQLPLINVQAKDLKRVYWLSDKLKMDTKHIEEVRALTLNKQKPFMGLKGVHGLFASSEWWDSVNKRKMPLLFISGKIIRVYETGQDHSRVMNTIDVETSDGKIEMVGIYTNNHQDIALFKVGSFVEIVYAQDELKQSGRDGSPAYSKIALEMAVSKSNM